MWQPRRRRDPSADDLRRTQPQQHSTQVSDSKELRKAARQHYKAGTPHALIRRCYDEVKRRGQAGEPLAYDLIWEAKIPLSPERSAWPEHLVDGDKAYFATHVANPASSSPDAAPAVPPTASKSPDAAVRCSCHPAALARGAVDAARTTAARVEDAVDSLVSAAQDAWAEIRGEDRATIIRGQRIRASEEFIPGTPRGGRMLTLHNVLADLESRGGDVPETLLNFQVETDAEAVDDDDDVRSGAERASTGGGRGDAAGGGRGAAATYM